MILKFYLSIKGRIIIGHLNEVDNTLIGIDLNSTTSYTIYGESKLNGIENWRVSAFEEVTKEMAYEKIKRDRKELFEKLFIS